jgi:hypothetical protein
VLWLRKGSTITPNVLKWLADTIRDYHWQLSPDWTTESDCCEEREPSEPTLFYFVKEVNESGTIVNEQIRICAHTMAYEEGFQEYNGDGCYFVAGILRIHGATGWTVWALSGEHGIQHLFKARGGSIDVSYPHAGMDSIWLSDSPN